MRCDWLVVCLISITYNCSTVRNANVGLNENRASNVAIHHQNSSARQRNATQRSARERTGSSRHSRVERTLHLDNHSLSSQACLREHAKILRPGQHFRLFCVTERRDR
jgi:hypothetical protein